MKEAYPLFILFAAVESIAGLLCVFALKKSKKYDASNLIIISCIFFTAALCMIAGMIIASPKLIISAIILPSGIFSIYTFIIGIIRCRKCTLKITAKYLGFSDHKALYAAIKFSYVYSGEEIESKSFGAYKIRKIKKVFRENESYEIYIDPDCPEHCVNKYLSHTLTDLQMLMFGILLLSLGVLILICV